MSKLNYYMNKPSFRLAEERVVERSNDLVSKLYGQHWRQCTGVDSPRLRCAGRPSLRLRRKEGEEKITQHLITNSLTQ
jgi:hypothetical protein